MPTAALAAAAPAPVVLLGEDEVALGRVIKIAGLQRLRNGSWHRGIKVTAGRVERTPGTILWHHIRLFAMNSSPCFVLPLLVGAAWLQAPAVVAQDVRPVVLTAASVPGDLRPALARDETAFAAPIREAQRTLPQAKKRFQAGLPQGDQLLVMVRVMASDTSFRPASARVLGWRGNMVQALLLPEEANTASPAEPLPVSFPEAAVVDWTLLRAGGREEGNYVGRYRDTARQLENLPFR